LTPQDNSVCSCSELNNPFSSLKATIAKPLVY
jgi:hypothetical protein